MGFGYSLVRSELTVFVRTLLIPDNLLLFLLPWPSGPERVAGMGLQAPGSEGRDRHGFAILTQYDSAWYSTFLAAVS